jgi:predicted ATPase/class 3 adenylate cyclase
VLLAFSVHPWAHTARPYTEIAKAPGNASFVGLWPATAVAMCDAFARLSAVVSRGDELNRPSGTVTFLFTDVEGSTRLWEEGSPSMAAALELHDRAIRDAVARHAGTVFATGGDGFAAAFGKASDAVSAAMEAQQTLHVADWPKGCVLRVRMGLHTGEAVERDGDYFGPTVNRAARLMALAYAGQVLCSAATAALARRDDVVLVPLGAQEVRDVAVPIEVFQLGDGDFPPLRSPASMASNLPVMRTEIVGREDEISVVMGRLRTSQLVSLTGVGGVGKTRVALAVAHALTGEFSDGCWFVDLAPLRDGRDVLTAIASTLGASLGAVANAPALVRYLTNRRLLLVLDNCEHVVDAVAEVVESVLDGAPEVTVLATSREALRVGGEVITAVRPLDNDLAVRLFEKRATAAAGDDALSETELATVAQICARLDGIPLAIELAAARTRAMPATEIARRLDERFALLTGDRGDARHRTLSAAIAWSYDLLADAEQVVFRRLAAFPSSFDLDAAETVAGGAVADVLGCLLRLVDRSLVQYERHDGRYRLLETLREFGVDRLADAGELDDVRHAHAEHYSRLLGALTADLSGPRYHDARSMIVGELDNLRAAGEWLVERSDWQGLYQLLTGGPNQLELWWTLTPTGTSGWCETLLTAAPLDADRRAVLMAQLGFTLCAGLGDFERSRAYAQASIELCKDEGSSPSPWAHLTLANIAQYTGGPDEALEEARRAVKLAEKLHDPMAEISSMGTLVNALYSTGDVDAGRDLGAETLRRADRTANGDIVSVAVVCVAGAEVFQRVDGDFTRVLDIIEQRRGQLARTGISQMWLDVVEGLALAGAGQARGADVLGRAILAADRLSVPHALNVAIHALGLSVADAGWLDDAALLAGYHRQLQDYEMRNNAAVWIRARLHEHLRSLGEDRTRLEQRGAAMTRADAIALVDHLRTIGVNSL